MEIIINKPNKKSWRIIKILWYQGQEKYTITVVIFVQLSRVIYLFEVSMDRTLDIEKLTDVYYT